MYDLGMVCRNGAIEAGQGLAASRMPREDQSKSFMLVSRARSIRCTPTRFRTLLIVDEWGGFRYDLDRHEHGRLGSVVSLLPPHVPHNGVMA